MDLKLWVQTGPPVLQLVFVSEKLQVLLSLEEQTLLMHELNENKNDTQRNDALEILIEWEEKKKNNWIWESFQPEI